MSGDTSLDRFSRAWFDEGRQQVLLMVAEANYRDAADEAARAFAELQAADVGKDGDATPND